MPEPTPPQPPPRRAALALMVAIVIGGTLFAAALMNAGQPSSRIRYDELERYVAEDRVERVVFSDNEIRGTYVEGRVPAGEDGEPTRRFVTSRLDEPGLVATLRDHGVQFEAEPSSRWPEGLSTVLSLGLTLLLFFFLFRMLAGRGGPAGALSFGKSRGKLVQEADIDVTFDDVAGADEAKEELEEVIELLRHPEKFERIGAKIPKGVLLVGPPGTGKTLLARAVAGEAGVPFISINGSEFVEMFVGVGAARVRDLFEQASQSAPCIVFIDELDALGRSRAAGGVVQNEERESTLNQLLVEMDGFAPRGAVILMAATNRPEVLDPALLRAGRFDRQILVDRPDRLGRAQILAVHSRKVPLAEDVDLEEVARRTPGFAGADLASLVNEAALLAARDDADAVTMDHLSAALDRVVAGLAKKSRLVDERERRRVATHEVGHALVAHLSESGDVVHKISIIPRGLGALGFTLNLPDREKSVHTATEIRAKLRALLGGRAAEEVVFGEPSTGAQNDLARATELARAMVTEHGMSERLGPVRLASGPQSPFLRGPVMGAAREHGDAVADQVDEEVRAIVTRALDEARTLLASHRDALDLITERLLEAEQLEGDALEALLAAAERASPQSEPLRPVGSAAS